MPALWTPTKAPDVESEDSKALAGWMEDELQRFQSDSLENMLALDLRPTFSQPLRPRTGMIIYADGTTYNPGAGEGAYTLLSSGLWAKLNNDIETLTADRIYYVRIDGNDLNTGRIDSPGGAFLTPQRAMDVIGQLDLNSRQVDVLFGAGTYPGVANGNCVTLRTWRGSGTVVFRSASGVASSVIFDGTGVAGTTFGFNGSFSPIPGVFRLQDVTIKGFILGIQSRVAGRFQITNISFENIGFCPIVASNLATIEPYGTLRYTKSAGGGPNYFMLADAGSTIQSNASDLPGPFVSLTIAGTPAWAVAFAGATNRSLLYLGNTGTWLLGTGATGSRYTSTNNSVINVGGASTTFFPGSTAGTAVTGLYV